MMIKVICFKENLNSTLRNSMTYNILKQSQQHNLNRLLR